MDLPDIQQEFVANVSRWLAGVEAMIAEGNRFIERNDESIASVEALQRAINSLDGKTVVVDTVFSGFRSDAMAEVIRDAESATGAMERFFQVGEEGIAVERSLDQTIRDASNSVYAEAEASRALADARRELSRAGFEAGLNEEEMARLANASGDALFRQGETARTTADKIRELTSVYDVYTNYEESTLWIPKEMSQALGMTAEDIQRTGNAVQNSGRQFRIWGTGITLSGIAMHRLVTASFDFLAVLIPASVALAAWGAAAAPTFQLIYQKMSAVYTVSEALGQNIYPLTGGFDKVAAAVQPSVYVLFGEALNVINSKTSEFATIAEGAGAVVDQLGARIGMALTSGGMSAFMKNAVSDLSGLGNVIGNIFGTIGNLLKVMPGYAQDVLKVLGVLSSALEAFTANPIIQWVLSWGLAMHGAYIWLGMVAASVVWLGNSLFGLLARLGLVTDGMLAFDAAAFGGGIKAMISAVGNLGTALFVLRDGEVAAAAGAEIMDGAMAAAGAVNPLIWVGLAVGAIAGLVMWFHRGSDAASQYANALQAALGTLPVSQLGVTLMQDLAVATKNAAAAFKLMQANGGFFGADSQQWKAAADTLGMLTTGMSNYNTLMKAAHGNTALLTEANITSGDIMTANKNQLAQYVFEVQAAYNAEKAMSLGAGQAAAAQNAMTNDFITSTVPAIQKMTQAEDTLLNVILGAPQAFTNFQQAVQGVTASFTPVSGLAQAAKVAGASLSGLNEQSLQLSNTFYSSSVPAFQKVLDAVQQQSIAYTDLKKVTATGVGEMLQYTKGNVEAKSVLVDMINNAIGPGTVSLQTLNSWVKQNSTSLQGMNNIIAQSTINAGSLAGVLENSLNAQFHQLLLETSGTNKELGKYTQALVSDQQNTKAGQGIRAQLIKDLENAGFSAQQAANYVNSLAASLGRIPKNTTATVTVTTNNYDNTFSRMINVPGGSAVHGAAGMRLPGYGGGDIVPAMLEPGEAVVPKHLVAGIAPYLGAHGVPGFKKGGVVESPMEKILSEWAGHIWKDYLHQFGKHGPIPLAKMKEIFGPTSFPRTGIWSNPQYRDLRLDERKDMNPYYLKDIMYSKVLGEIGGIKTSEASQIAKYQADIKKGNPAEIAYWTKVYKKDAEYDVSQAAYYNKLLDSTKDAKLRQDYLKDINRYQSDAVSYEKKAANEKYYYKDLYEGDISSLKKEDAKKLAEYGEELKVIFRSMGYARGGLIPFGHYDQGGYLPLGLSMALNTTGRPEPVGGSGGGGDGGTMHVHLHVDGREIAQAVLPSMVGATSRYGIRNSGRVTGLLKPS